MSAAEAATAARARHPTGRARGAHLVDLARRLHRVEAVLGPHGDVAVAARAVRGRRGHTVGAFAVAFGVSEQLVIDLEAGLVAPAQVPAPLAVLTEIGELVAALGGREGAARIRGGEGVGATGPTP